MSRKPIIPDPPRSNVVSTLKSTGAALAPTVIAHGYYRLRADKADELYKQQIRQANGVGQSAAYDILKARTLSNAATTSYATSIGASAGSFLGPAGALVGGLIGFAAGNLNEVLRPGPNVNTAYDRNDAVNPFKN